MPELLPLESVAAASRARVVVIALLAVAIASGWFAQGSARAADQASMGWSPGTPRAVVTGIRVDLVAGVRGLPSGTTVRLQQSSGSHTATIAAGHVATGLRKASVAWRAPARPGSVRLRVVAFRRGRVLAHTTYRKFAVRRTVLTRVRRRNTVELTDHQVLASSGDPSGAQTVSLASSVPAVRLGSILVAPVAAQTPHGLLAKVTDVHRTNGGQWQLTTVPATLSDAYSSIQVGVSGSLEDLKAHIAGTHAGLAALGGLHVGGTDLDCDGTGGGPSVSFDADFSKVHFDVSLNSYQPSLYFLAAGSPTISLDTALSATATCSLKLGEIAAIHIPVSATPPLEVVLRPAFSVSTQGAVGLHVEWSPRIVLGFSRGGGADSDTHSIKYGKTVVRPAAMASADLFGGVDAELSLAGRVGIDAQFGPDARAQYDAAKPGCLSVDAVFKAQLAAHADILVKDWDFALASGEFGDVPIFNSCKAASPYTTNAGPAQTAPPRMPLPLQTPGTAGSITGRLSTAGPTSCAIRSSGQAVCWGADTYGMLGNGGGMSSTTPVNVEGLGDATAISVGGSSVCAIRTGGQVVCWGANQGGQLGNGTRSDSRTPVSVPGLSDAVAITVGLGRACALRRTQAVVCWGNLGFDLADTSDSPLNGNGDALTPIPMPGGSGASAVDASGNGGICAVDAGRLVCWLEAYLNAPFASVSPLIVPTITNAVSTDGGGGQLCALLSDGHIHCLGNNSSGELGDGTTIVRSEPTPVVGIADAVEVSAGSGSTCALLATDSIDCWGANDRGQLGDGTEVSRLVPTPVSGLQDALTVATDGGTACAVRATGQAVCWGDGADGQLGNGDTHDSAVPVGVSGLSDIATIP